MLYVLRDQEGKEIIDLLKQNDIECRVFTCTKKEKLLYDCPSLLTTEGHFKGKDGIQYYIQQRPFLESLRYERESKLSSWFSLK